MTTRSKSLLIILILVAGIFVAAYATAPALLAYVVARQLDGVVEVDALDIGSIGLQETNIPVLRVHNKQMRLAARQATIVYDLWPFEIRRVAIHRVELQMEGSRSSGGQGAALPALPAFPLRIDSFAFSAATPWGPVALPESSVVSGPSRAGGFNAAVRNNDITLELDNPEPRRHDLQLSAADGVTLLSLTLTSKDDGILPGRFEGRIDPQATVRWGRESPLLPRDLVPLLSPYVVDGTSVEFSGSLQETGGFTMELNGEIAVSDERPASERLFDRMGFRAGPGYTIERNDQAWSGSGEGRFEVSLDSDTTLTGNGPNWRWDGNALSFKATDPVLPRVGVSAASVAVTTDDLSATRTNGGISIKNVDAPWWPEPLAHYDVNGQWSWDGSGLRSSGGGTAGALPMLSWSIDTGSGRGTVEVSGSEPLSGLAPSLHHYTEALARELTILNGDLEARYRLEWDANHQQTTLAITAGPADADLDEMEVRGFELDLSNRERTIDEIDVTLSAPTVKLAAGTVAEDFELALRLSPPQVQITKARARLFGGEIALRPATFSLNEDSITLFADIEALSLGRVMSLLELETTELTGDVSGPVRVVYTKGRGIELNEGNLHSVEPGVLRFSLNPGSDMTAQLNNIALRALENFQYDELNASVLYKPDGEYRIAARIVGRNPEVLNGHPIALNPTIEGRLPALFRAFFITGDFSRAIIERLREEQSSSTSGETPTFDQE